MKRAGTVMKVPACLFLVLNAMGAAILWPATANAATTTQFEVKAEIVSGCEVNGVLPGPAQPLGNLGALNFGVHSSLSTGTLTANLTQTAELTLICTPDVDLSMSIDSGQNSAATRNLQFGSSANRIPYRLFSNLDVELPPGQPTTVSFTSPVPVSLPIKGRLTLPGNLPAGNYTDTVTVTLNW